MSDSLRPHELYSPWNSPGQNAGAYALVTVNCYLLFFHILCIFMLPGGFYFSPELLSAIASLMKSFSLLKPSSNVTPSYILLPHFFLGKMNLFPRVPWKFVHVELLETLRIEFYSICSFQI